MKKLYELFKQSGGVSTDTRCIAAGSLFFALKGERFNGNLFAEKALQAGAIAAVVDEKYFEENERILIADNSLHALQMLAHHHRRQLKAKVIAVCGSNGKTTTRELTARVLGSSFATYATKGNLNNHIGVPLSLLEMNEEHEFAVIEIGANHLGETKLLCELAEPEFGLITNNGKDHLEGYGSIEGVRQGNGELFEFLKSANGTAFVCAGQQDLMKMSEGMNRVTYGATDEATCRGNLMASYPFVSIETKGTLLNTQLIGLYNFDNVMAAVCIGRHFGVKDDDIKRSIESYVPANNRSQLLQQGSNTFILDAYNANPSSVSVALHSFASLPAEKKILILGDMAELGAASESEHRAVIAQLTEGNWEMVLLVGSEFQKADAENRFRHFRNVSELKEWFSTQSFSETYFLLKASRIISLEKIFD